MMIMENIGSKSVRDQRNGMIMGTARKGKSLGTVKKNGVGIADIGGRYA